jgi:hypothetical protein
MKTGNVFEGAFTGLDLADLLLTDSTGIEFTVARLEVASIVARATRDPLTNGILIGAGIGLGTAVTILAMLASGDGYLLPSAKWGAPLLLSGAGAVIGLLVDRAQTRGETLYVAP